MIERLPTRLFVRVVEMRTTFAQLLLKTKIFPLALLAKSIAQRNQQLLKTRMGELNGKGR